MRCCIQHVSSQIPSRATKNQKHIEHKFRSGPFFHSLIHSTWHRKLSLHERMVHACEAWRHLPLLLYLSKPLPGNLGEIQVPPATTYKMLLHVNLICMSTLNLFQLCHPYVYEGRKVEQGERKAAECLFWNHHTLILTSISCWISLLPTPFQEFSKPSSHLPPSVHLPQIFINTTKPSLEMSSLCKGIRFKITTTGQASFNALAFLSLREWLWLKLRSKLTGGTTTWEVNRQWTWTAKASQWSGQDAAAWKKWFKLKRCFFELTALVDVTGSVWEEGQELTALPSSDSSAFDAHKNIAQRWSKKASVSSVSSHKL